MPAARAIAAGAIDAATRGVIGAIARKWFVPITGNTQTLQHRIHAGPSRPDQGACIRAEATWNMIRDPPPIHRSDGSDEGGIEAFSEPNVA